MGFPVNFRHGKRDATQSTVHHYGRGLGDRARGTENVKRSAVHLKMCCACLILAPVLFPMAGDEWRNFLEALAVVVALECRHDTRPLFCMSPK
jgi:hypothetical protein